MTSPIEPGTPVTVVLTGEYLGWKPAAQPRPVHHVGGTHGRIIDVPADASIAAADGSDPVVLTPAIRSMAHRAARALPVTATPGQAVEAALSALEPVVAGLLKIAEGAGHEAAVAAVRAYAASQSGEDATPRAGLIGRAAAYAEEHR